MPANREKKQFPNTCTKSLKNVIQRCSSKNKRGKFTKTGTIGLCASCPASLAPTSQKDGTLPTNPTEYFNLNFVVDTCWRANTPVLTTQLSEMYNEKQVEEGQEPTAGHSYWFSDHPKWLISAWVAAGLQIRNDHVVQKKMLTTFWTKTQEDVLLLLQMYLLPTKNLVGAAMQHIRQAMPRVGVTMNTRLFVSALAKEVELQQLWKAGEVVTGASMTASERHQAACPRPGRRRRSLGGAR